MELLALNCQRCGAPLKVPGEAKYVTCTHCGSQLVVRQTGSVAYTEMLDAIDARTERMAEQIDDLHQQAALADLDRRWEQECESYYVEGRDGHRSLPTKAGSIAGGVVIAGFGVLGAVVASSVASAFNDELGGLFGLLGLVSIIAAVWMCRRNYQKADAYERGYALYQQERDRLLRSILDENEAISQIEP